MKLDDFLEQSESAACSRHCMPKIVIQIRWIWPTRRPIRCYDHLRDRSALQIRTGVFTWPIFLVLMTTGKQKIPQTMILWNFTIFVANFSLLLVDYDKSSLKIYYWQHWQRNVACKWFDSKMRYCLVSLCFQNTVINICSSSGLKYPLNPNIDASGIPIA